MTMTNQTVNLSPQYYFKFQYIKFLKQYKKSSRVQIHLLKEKILFPNQQSQTALTVTTVSNSSFNCLSACMIIVCSCKVGGPCIFLNSSWNIGTIRCCPFGCPFICNLINIASSVGITGMSKDRSSLNHSPSRTLLFSPPSAALMLSTIFKINCYPNIIYSYLFLDQNAQLINTEMREMNHCFKTIFFAEKLTLSVSSFSLISCESIGVTLTTSKCSIAVSPNTCTINISYYLLYTANLSPQRLIRLQEAIRQERMVFLFAIAISGEWREQSSLFWAMIPMLVRLLGEVSGPSRTLVRKSFLKWLTFSRQPLVLMTIISHCETAIGNPKTKGYMINLFLIFSFSFTNALLVFPILYTSLPLSLITQKNLFTFSSFSILKLKPPPKSVTFTFFSPSCVSQLKPQPNFLNQIGIFGIFLGFYLSRLVETMWMQLLYTFYQEFPFILEGNYMLNLHISLSLFRSTFLAQPKALQRQRLLAMKVECRLERKAMSPVWAILFTPSKHSSLLLFLYISLQNSLNTKRRMKLSTQATQKESSLPMKIDRGCVPTITLNSSVFLVRKLQKRVALVVPSCAAATERNFIPFSFSILLLQCSPASEKPFSFSIISNSRPIHPTVFSKNPGGK